MQYTYFVSRHPRSSNRNVSSPSLPLFSTLSTCCCLCFLQWKNSPPNHRITTTTREMTVVNIAREPFWVIGALMITTAELALLSLTALKFDVIVYYRKLHGRPRQSALPVIEAIKRGMFQRTENCTERRQMQKKIRTMHRTDNQRNDYTVI